MSGVPSFRGLEDGFPSIPVTHFKGKLEKFSTEIATEGKAAGKEYIYLSFSDLKVIETKEPWNFPILQLPRIPNSNRKKSTWGILAQSGLKFLKDDEDFPNLVGRMLEMKVTPGHMMWDSDKGEETPRDCWEIVGVEGTAVASSALSPLEEAVKLLDGKTEADFNQAAFQSDVVKKGGLIPAILDRSENGFIGSLIAIGRVAKDDNGVFHIIG